jgi:CRISPR-associated protein Csd1
MYNLENLHDEIVASFQKEDFTNDKKLTGEFLLGYHCQRHALKTSAAKSTADANLN